MSIKSSSDNVGIRCRWCHWDRFSPREPSRGGREYETPRYLCYILLWKKVCSHYLSGKPQSLWVPPPTLTQSQWEGTLPQRPSHVQGNGIWPKGCVGAWPPEARMEEWTAHSMFWVVLWKQDTNECLGNYIRLIIKFQGTYVCGEKMKYSLVLLCLFYTWENWGMKNETIYPRLCSQILFRVLRGDLVLCP